MPKLKRFLNWIPVIPIRTISTLILFCSIYSSDLMAGDIKGHVYDKYSREQLIGATISVNRGSFKAVSSLEGKYNLKNLAAGKYNITISFIGYVPLDTSLQFIGGTSLEIDFYLVPESSTLNAVQIAAKANGETEAYARKKEQYASNIMNIMSANTIAISPDITVSNVIQRISGVSVDRSGSGDGQHPIIRGMDKRYNTTLVNGIKIPSPDNKNRYVPLDIFPAEMVDRIEVIKSLTPDMEGDATGGSINLVMKSAPSSFRVEANLASGYSQFFLRRDYYDFSRATVQKKSPSQLLPAGTYAKISDFPVNNLITGSGQAPANRIFGLTIGDRFLKEKLGVIFSGSYQGTYRGALSNSLVQSPTVPPVSGPEQPQNPAFSNILVRDYSYQINRFGSQLRLDYQFNKRHSISLFSTYVKLNEFRVRNTIDSTLGGYSINNYVGSFAVYNRLQTRSDLQQIFNTTLQGKDLLGQHLSLDWWLVYSKAARQLPDIAEFSWGRQINPDFNSGSLAVGPDFVRKQTREWIRNTDQDLSAFLNFHYPLNFLESSGKTFFGFGGMSRQKHRDNYNNLYNLTPVADSGTNDQLFTSIPEARFTFVPSNAALGNAAGNAGIYTFDENVSAIFAQVSTKYYKNWELLFGLRTEHTLQRYESSLPVTVDGKYGRISYTDFLPSIQAKYTLNTPSAVRFSYFKSIYRPAFADLIPFLDNSTNENYATTGNPFLQHTKTDNIDLRYEYFAKGLDQFMLGAFYKFIKNPIEYALTQNGFTEQQLKPDNFGNANNFGFELVFRKYFGNFGVSGNYTYTNSEIQSAKNVYYIDANGNTVNSTVLQKRPLQGQSAHIGNFSLLYKSIKGKFDIQIALVYTGSRINTLSLYKNLDNWEKATTYLDLSAQKQFGKHFIFFIKANNLLNTPFELVIKQPNSSYNGQNKLPFQESSAYRTVQYDKYFSNYILGFRFKFLNKQ